MGVDQNSEEVCILVALDLALSDCNNLHICISLILVVCTCSWEKSFSVQSWPEVMATLVFYILGERNE